MSLFDKGNQISRIDFRRYLRRASSRIPDSGQRIPYRQRIGIEKDFFPEEKFGAYISKSDFQRKIRELARQRYSAKPDQKIDIERKINYLKYLGGL